VPGNSMPAKAQPAKAQPAKTQAAKDKSASGDAAAAKAPPAHITIDEFARVEMRVARVVEASVVDGSDKLLRLLLDLGGEQRQVFSGIRAAYAPGQLAGRLVVVVANLAPRKMRFGTSEGMVLCAGDGSGLFLLAADSGAQPGMKVS